VAGSRYFRVAQRVVVWALFLSQGSLGNAQPLKFSGDCPGPGCPAEPRLAIEALEENTSTALKSLGVEDTDVGSLTLDQIEQIQSIIESSVLDRSEKISAIEGMITPQ
jgi:hypothetical protein